MMLFLLAFVSYRIVITSYLGPCNNGGTIVLEINLLNGNCLLFICQTTVMRLNSEVPLKICGVWGYNHNKFIPYSANEAANRKKKRRKKKKAVFLSVKSGVNFYFLSLFYLISHI